MSACDELDGSPHHQVIRFQAMAPPSAAEITDMSTMFGIDDALADGVGHVQLEDGEGDEVEERRPEHRLARREHARRHHGGDGVGRVVEAVDVVEDERGGDDRDDEDELVIHGASRRSRGPRPR